MNTRYHGLTLKQIIQQLNMDQFTRLCSAIDSKYGKGTKFDILSIKPFRNSKDESKITISVLLSSTNTVQLFEIHEKL